MLAFFRSTLGAAVLIGCLFVFLALVFLGRGGTMGGSARATRRNVDAVGTVASLNGDAEQRAPGSMEFTALVAGAPVGSGEQIFAHETSQVVLKFTGGASIRLEPGARLVAEHDSSRADAVLATLINGDATVLAPGAAGTFRLVKEGHDITSTGSSAELDAAASAKIVSGGARVFGAGASAGVASAAAEGTGAVVVASTPIETAASLAPATPAAGVGAAAVASKDVDEKAPGDSLSNEEIRKQLRSAGGYFQRCFITYLNRARTDEKKTALIVVGFTISNMGKARDAKVVRSDINDATLNGCIVETVERTPFRAFKGKDIPVLEFPIELK